MVNMMKDEQIKRLSPEGRVKNSYQSMYYRVNSGDYEMDFIIQQEMRSAFRDMDITLRDEPDEQMLRNVMLRAYKNSAEDVRGNKLNAEQIQIIEQDFDQFRGNHKNFYPATFESYERLNGVPVDFEADYARFVRENDGVDPRIAEPTDDDLEKMAREQGYGEIPDRPKAELDKDIASAVDMLVENRASNHTVRDVTNKPHETKSEQLTLFDDVGAPNKAQGVADTMKRAVESGIHHTKKAFDPNSAVNQALRAGVTPKRNTGKNVAAGVAVASRAIDPDSKLNQTIRSGIRGLNYAGHAPEAKEHATTQTRSFKQKRLEEQAANDIKSEHTRHDKAYEDVARNGSDSYAKFTAGDDYGFDERDNEIEDSGPEL